MSNEPQPVEKSKFHYQKHYLAPVREALTFQMALQTAEAILQLDELAESDYLQLNFVWVLLGSLNKASDWSTVPPAGDGSDPEPAHVRAAHVLREATRYCPDVFSVILLTTPIPGFPQFHDLSPVGIRLRGLQAEALADGASLAVNSMEATQLANRIGQPDHYLGSEFLQLQIGRYFIAAASLEEKSDSLDQIELLFQKLPSLATSKPLREMKSQLSSVAGTRVQQTQEQRARLLARASWAIDSCRGPLDAARAIRDLPHYATSKDIQTFQVMAILGGLRGDVDEGEAGEAFSLLFENPVFWSEQSFQDQYLEVAEALANRFGYSDGLCAGRHFDSDVLYDSSYQQTETSGRKLVNRYLAIYRKRARQSPS